MSDAVAAKARDSRREFLASHPWIQFRLDLSRVSPWFWESVGEARSKCRHLALTPLKPAVAARLHTLYLAKGAHATTAIEGNTLTEEQVQQAIEGDLELPRSQEYLRREVVNIVAACNAIAARTSNEGFQLSVGLLKDLNRQVLDGLEVADHVVPGEFTETPIGVGRYRGVPPRDVEFLTGLLVDWLNGDDFPKSDDQRQQFVTALSKAVIAHLYIAWIHPFGDGNGRTARLVEFGLLTATGIPSPAAHLLSNHYNQTRAVYYRRLDEASRSGGDVRPFMTYAVEGFVDQLQQQLNDVHEQVLSYAWENYAHEQFQDRHGATAKRQRDLVLALSARNEAVRRADLRYLTPELAEAYAGKQAKTVTRDINVLLDLDLIERTVGGFRARTELMYSFMPGADGSLFD
jgi:Fic family protein